MVAAVVEEEEEEVVVEVEVEVEKKAHLSNRNLQARGRSVR